MRVCAFLSVVLFQVLLSVWSSRCELYEPHLDKDESNDLINLNQLDSNELKHDQKLKNFFDIFSNRQNINDQLLYQDGLGSFNNLLYKKPIKRSRLIKKTKPITHNGYSLDINVENFKSMRVCHFNEICKNRYKPYFECVCPTSTLCTGQGSLFEGKCSNHLMPYVWLQNPDENSQKSKAKM